MCYPAAGLKARKRAQFAAAVKCITELDDAGLRLVLGYIPAWVKFSEYERARCGSYLRPILHQFVSNQC